MSNLYGRVPRGAADGQVLTSLDIPAPRAAVTVAADAGSTRTAPPAVPTQRRCAPVPVARPVRGPARAVLAPVVEPVVVEPVVAPVVLAPLALLDRPVVAPAALVAPVARAASPTPLIRTVGGKAPSKARAALVLVVLALLALGVMRASNQAPQDRMLVSTTTQDKGEQQALASVDPLPIGHDAAIGEYTVAVNASSAAAGGRLMVTASLTYNGSGQGQPSEDLTAMLTDSEGRQYGALQQVVLNGPDGKVLRPGVTTDATLVLNLTASGVVGGQLVVEQGSTLNPDKAFWSLG
jgi:hypothetical protein